METLAEILYRLFAKNYENCGENEQHNVLEQLLGTLNEEQKILFIKYENQNMERKCCRLKKFAEFFIDILMDEDFL